MHSETLFSFSPDALKDAESLVRMAKEAIHDEKGQRARLILAGAALIAFHPSRAGQELADEALGSDTVRARLQEAFGAGRTRKILKLMEFGALLMVSEDEELMGLLVEALARGSAAAIEASGRLYALARAFYRERGTGDAEPRERLRQALLALRDLPYDAFIAYIREKAQEEPEAEGEVRMGLGELSFLIRPVRDGEVLEEPVQVVVKWPKESPYAEELAMRISQLIQRFIEEIGNVMIR